MKPAASDAKYMTHSAMSSGRPTRPAGCCSWSFARSLGALRFERGFQASVAIQPGAIALTRTSGPRLIAGACVSADKPPLEATYASVPGSDIVARVELMLMIEPWLLRRCLAACFAKRNAPVRFT